MWATGPLSPPRPSTCSREHGCCHLPPFRATPPRSLSWRVPGSLSWRKLAAHHGLLRGSHGGVFGLGRGLAFLPWGLGCTHSLVHGASAYPVTSSTSWLS